MSGAVMVLVLLLATLLQSAIPAAPWLASSKVPLLLAVVLYYALTHRRGMFLTVAILAGVIQDSMSLMPVGSSALCFVALGLFVLESRGVLFRDSVPTVTALGAALGALTTAGLYVLLRAGIDMAEVPLWWLMLKMGGNALLGGLVAPVVWVAARALEDHVGIPRGEGE